MGVLGLLAVGWFLGLVTYWVLANIFEGEVKNRAVKEATGSYEQKVKKLTEENEKLTDELSEMRRELKKLRSKVGSEEGS
jgi:prefoldin subunit 5